MENLRINSNGNIVRTSNDNCAVCVGSLTPFTVSENTNGGSYGAMGDQHYAFGLDLEANGVTAASFNVDDNNGTDDLVWFYAKKGSIEYTIIYTQQEFSFTNGGKSIDTITISETGQSDITYYLGGVAPTQATYKNDGTTDVPYSSFDQFTLGDNIAQVSVLPRAIPGSSDCNAGDDFGLFHLDVHFADGLYEVDEIGGALYYLWKTAKDTTGLQNTISSDDPIVDSLGIYLASGSTGFTSRTQFESTVPIANMSEVKDSPTIEEIAIKFNELAGLNGTWDADWDPLASTVPECGSEPIEFLNCQVEEGVDFLPMMKVTLSWTDDVAAGMDGSGKVSYMHATGKPGVLDGYSNGQTRHACPSTYILGQEQFTNSSYGSPVSAGSQAQEHWSKGDNSQHKDQEFRALRQFRSYTHSGSSYVRNRNELIINKRNNDFGVPAPSSDYTNFDYSQWVGYSANSISTTYDYNALSMGVPVMNTPQPSYGDYRLGAGMFVTWTDPVTTITYKFEQGPYWNCLEKAFVLRKAFGIIRGDTEACAAMYTISGGLI